MPPALVKYLTLAEYQNHYENKYCRAPVTTFDNIPVFFKKETFAHAFFESSGRRGEKDIFSPLRAERIDWIDHALKDLSIVRYQGWDNKKKRYDPTWRVSLVVNDFVVVLRLTKGTTQPLKANFVTCFHPDTPSYNKLIKAPHWDVTACLAAL